MKKKVPLEIGVDFAHKEKDKTVFFIIKDKKKGKAIRVPMKMNLTGKPTYREPVKFLTMYYTEIRKPVKRKTMGFAKACKVFKHDPIFQAGVRKAMLAKYKHELILPKGFKRSRP